MRFRIFALAILAVAQVPMATSAQPDQGAAVLRRALDQAYSFDATVILRRTDWSGETSMFSATFVKNQGYKAVMIHPSIAAGQAQVDNGKTMYQWLPDDRLVLDRASLDQFTPHLETRIKWTLENYDVYVEGTEVRLGRDVTRLVLKSKFGPEVGNHVFLVDNKLPLVISEIATAEGGAAHLAEVVGIRENPGVTTIDINLPEKVEHREVWGPKDVTDMIYAASAIGFTPRAPQKLPFNFRYFAKQLVGEESSPFIVYRLTDGLSIVHVYEWKYEHGKKSERSGIPAVRFDKSRDIAYGIVADCAPGAQAMILDAFVGKR